MAADRHADRPNATESWNNPTTYGEKQKEQSAELIGGGTAEHCCVEIAGVMAGVGALVGSGSLQAPINSQCALIANGFG